MYVSPYWFLVAGRSSPVRQARRLAGSSGVRYVVAATFVILLYAVGPAPRLSHCVVARAFRLPVRRILLYPLGGFSEIEQEPPTPGQEFLISRPAPLCPSPWPGWVTRS